MMERVFHLSENNTTVRREIVSGLTIFLTMSYILFTNSDILSEAGMPWDGVFVVTALTSAVCTIVIALYADLPFAMAPGMGLNTVFAYTLCMNMGYHWKEALAIAFLSGILHVIIMSTPLRKAFVNAFPEYLRVAAGAGLGMFIAYVGIKNTGLLVIDAPAGQYEPVGNGSMVRYFSFVPSLMYGISAAQVVAVIGLAVMIILMALERKTGDQYAALPLGILIATFIGIPLNVTRLNEAPLSEISMIEGFGQVFLSFFGKPGLLSLFSDVSKAARTLMMICVLNMTSVLDSVGTMIGIGQIHNAKLFDPKDMEKFSQKGTDSKLDKALIANAFGGTLSPLFGSSSATIYLESVTGIVSGGRTGLTGLVVGILFLLCLPFSAFFHIIPTEAVAPALILASVSMLTRMRYIDWTNFEESFPTFMTILFMPLAYNVLDGIATGILCHVTIQITLGNRREVHPILFALSILYIAIKFNERFLFLSTHIYR